MRSNHPNDDYDDFLDEYDQPGDTIFDVCTLTCFPHDPGIYQLVESRFSAQTFGWTYSPAISQQQEEAKCEKLQQQTKNRGGVAH